ncbi:MAG: hypothetical protein M1819_000740 [Sarea resinae]|nr:MAG: hypothetical protein M1819_000740 [Sarea resinae]
MATPTIELAILDDYQNVAFAHFEKTHPRQLQITCIPSTLPPFSHPSTTAAQKAELIARLRPFQIISTMRERTPFPRELLAELPNLRLLLTTGPYNAAIDMAAAKELGIAVCGTTGGGRSDRPAPAAPSNGTDSTTQHAWALILGLARHIARDDAVVKAGGWQTDLAVGLVGKTLGLVGLGRLGPAVGRIGVLAFGMKVAAWSSSLTQAGADEKARAAGLPVTDPSTGEKTFRAVSKAALFETADVVSVHYTLSPRSAGIVGAAELGAMKKSALLVNTSRGPVVDEAALLAALQDGAIRGAALDVFELEPLPPHSAWRTTPWGQHGRSEVVLSPHMGYVEEATVHAWYDETAENVERWIDGRELRSRIN